MAAEVWKAVPGYGGHFEASTYGRIRRVARVVWKRCYLTNHDGGRVAQSYHMKILSGKPSADGYITVHIGWDGRTAIVPAHGLVLLAFVGPCPTGMEACHFNGDPSDNRPSNLRWDTHAANMSDRKRHGRYYSDERHPMARFTDADVEVIRTLPKGEAMRRFEISRSHYHRIINKQSRRGAT